MKFYLVLSFFVIFAATTNAVGRKKIVPKKGVSISDSKTTTTTTTTVEPPQFIGNTDDPFNAFPLKSFNYPKKVTSLKKRPTKTPTLVVSKNATTTTVTTKHLRTKDFTEVFKDLPKDDFEFIKELDKQFKLHGEKLKIRVQNDNLTDAKNTAKRTIDGELGLAYQHNGYSYEPPKFMFYPYSQKNIAPDAPAYYPQYESTSVTIEPSYSYELKPQTYIETHKEQPQPQIDLPQEQQQHEIGGEQHYEQPQQHNEYDEPVIVLRIPGPSKYASHLRTLLQQYLEIRAAQYLKILEETEQRKLQQSQEHIEAQQEHQQQLSYHNQQEEQILQQQHYQQQQQYQQQEQDHHHHHSHQQHYEEPSVDYQAPPAVPAGMHGGGYNPEVAFAHQVAPTPGPISYAPIDDVYQGIKGRHQYQDQQQPHHHHPHHHQVHAQQPTQHQQDSGAYYADIQTYSHVPQPEQQYVSVPQQQYYYTTADQNSHGPMHGHAGHQSYQQIYVVAMAAPSGYVEQQPAHHLHKMSEQPIYVPEAEGQHHQQYAHAQYEDSHHQDPTAPISENSPRPTHTKVLFTEQDAADHSAMYPLPSIRPYERVAPTSTPIFHQQYQEQHPALHSLTADDHAEYHQQQHAVASEIASSVAPQHDGNTVAITQRPFNYHAHSAKPRMRSNRKRGLKKAVTAPVAAPTVTTTSVEISRDEADENLQKIRTFVKEKLGAQTGSAIEFQTSELVHDKVKKQ